MDHRSESAHGEWTASRHGLVGRDEELRRVRQGLITGIRHVTLLGIAGAGKTSLADAAAAAAEASGWTVLRVQGRSTETMLGFTVLLDLLDAGAARHRGEAPGASLRRQLSGAGDHGVPEPLALRRAVQQWLLDVAGEGRLLVVVDDAHWVDQASWHVLAFIANRLRDTAVSLLVTARSDVVPAGLDERSAIALPPLEVADATVLLAREAPLLDPLLRSAIVDRASGNPLALVELARAGAPSTTGVPQLRDTVPPALEAAFGVGLPELPEPTRRLLLLASAGAVDVADLARAARPGEVVADLLEPAERTGLVRMHERRVLFRHPLVQATVYGLATAGERRRAHEELAALYPDDDDRHVWHSASATEHPDEAIAAALLAAAERMRVRGAGHEAADAALRAAELTPDPVLREERILDGISMSAGPGHVQRMAQVAEHLRRTSPHPTVRARATHLHGYALAQSMQQAAARDLLELALAGLIDREADAGWASLTSLASVTYQTCQRTGVLAQWLQRYEATGTHDIATHPLNAASWVWVRTALDPLTRDQEVRQLLRTAPDQPVGEWPAHFVAAYAMMLGAAAWLLDEHPTALHHLVRSSDLMQRSGSTQLLPQTTMALGQLHFDMGRYDQAERSALLLLDLAEADGLPYYQAAARELRARVLAVRGESAAALAEIDIMLAGAEPGQAVALEANLWVGRACALMGLRRHEEAYQQLRRLFDLDGEPVHPHISYRALADVVAAAARVGRTDEVRAIVRRAAERLHDLPGQRMIRVLSRARAQLADDASAPPLFERAVNEPGAEIWPLEWGQAQLEYGAWLRRQRRVADARPHLLGARQVFTRLGAAPWISATDAELRAAGALQDTPPARWDELTAQEREVVLLAASGMSNKEIAQALLLSPRTVGSHLYHAYPKLGVSARTQLRDVVERLEP